MSVPPLMLSWWVHCKTYPICQDAPFLESKDMPPAPPGTLFYLPLHYAKILTELLYSNLRFLAQCVPFWMFGGSNEACMILVIFLLIEVKLVIGPNSELGIVCRQLRYQLVLDRPLITLWSVGTHPVAWSIFFYHQDLHQWRLQTGSHPDLSALNVAPSYLPGLHPTQHVIVLKNVWVLGDSLLSQPGVWTSVS